MGPYQDNLLLDMYPVDVSLLRLGEPAVSHECEMLPSFFIVDAQDNRVVIVVQLEKIKACKVVHVELALAERHSLIHALVELDFLQVVLFVWRVEHDGCVVHVLLLLHATVYAHIRPALAVHFERDL